MIDMNIFLADIQKMLGIEEEIDSETDLLDLEGWDSFSMMSFIVMVEEKYNVTLEPFSVAGAILVEDLYDAVNDAVERN